MELSGTCRIYKQEFRLDFYEDNNQSESFSLYKGIKFPGFVMDSKRGFYLT